MSDQLRESFEKHILRYVDSSLHLLRNGEIYTHPKVYELWYIYKKGFADGQVCAALNAANSPESHDTRKAAVSSWGFSGYIAVLPKEDKPTVEKLTAELERARTALRDIAAGRGGCGEQCCANVAERALAGDRARKP